jgi:pyruvate/2-oxoglutarate dehydrogenase complex dihydrolipoamide acyltransferase (E2) component
MIEETTALEVATEEASKPKPKRKRRSKKADEVSVQDVAAKEEVATIAVEESWPEPALSAEAVSEELAPPVSEPLAVSEPEHQPEPEPELEPKQAERPSASTLTQAEANRGITQRLYGIGRIKDRMMNRRKNK